MKLLIMHFSPVSCHFLPLNPNDLPHDPILDYPQPVFLPQCDSDQVSNPNNTPSKTTVLYILIHTILVSERECNRLNRTAAGTPLMPSALHLFCTVF